MPGVPQPETAAQVLDTVAWAVSQDTPLEVLGTGTKRAFGRPLTHLGNIGHTLDPSALAGITLYEPEELVLSAGPATPLAEIAAALAARGQELAFEPPDYGPLLGRSEEHTSDHQSLMRLSYAVHCLEKTLPQQRTR